MYVSELPSIGECQQLVSQPGPYFQEPRYVPYFDALIRERAFDSDDDGYSNLVVVTEEHQKMFKELTVGQYIRIKELPDGSVTTG